MKIGAPPRSEAPAREAIFAAGCAALLFFSVALMWLARVQLTLPWYDPVGRAWSVSAIQPAPAAMDYYAKIGLAGLLSIAGGACGFGIARRIRLRPIVLRGAGAAAIGATVLGLAWYEYSLLTRRLPIQAPPPPSSTGVAAPPIAATTPPRKSPRRIVVPEIDAELHLDGEIEETAWHAAGRTGPFVVFGSPDEAHPYSDARFLRDAHLLYVALYAADEDQRRGSDAFDLTFVDPRDASRLEMSISVDHQLHEKRVKDGVETPWSSRARYGVDADGTLDNASDEDEEWTVELAIPLSSLGITGDTISIGAMISRCDTPKDSSAPICGAWGRDVRGDAEGVLVLSGDLLPGLPTAQDHD